MIHLQRTEATHPDFLHLVKALDIDLAERDGPDHAFYAQFNTVEQIKHIMVAYEDQQAIGCGAIKPYDAQTCEIKRMYLLPAHRGKGVASQVLNALEAWAKTLGFKKCILETGYKQPEAIRLYEKNGYQRITNYGQYAGVENSLCFGKEI
ncbi:MAG: GNAT family N-acetyltransferase [Saprospiraceae bacterium]